MGPNTAQDESEPRFVSFVDLYDAHVDDLYRFVHRRCRNHGLAEDITQDAFMTALQNHQPDQITIGWLKRVASNRLVDVLRRRSTYDSKLRLVGQGTQGGTEPDVAERFRVEAALDGLSIEYRIVLTLHYLDGMTVAAIAEDLDRSSKSVEGLVTRARRQLRAALGDSDV